MMLALGLVRILCGPGDADRMMAAQLIGTGGIASLLLLGAVTGGPAAVDVAQFLLMVSPARRIGFSVSAAVERVDGALRQWPMAGIFLLALALLLGAAILVNP